MTVDIKAIRDVILNELGDVLSGTARDLKEFGTKIAESLISAAKSGDASRKAELIAQLRAVAEIQRVRVNKRAWAVVEKVASTALGVLSATLGGLPGAILGVVTNTGDSK